MSTEREATDSRNGATEPTKFTKVGDAGLRPAEEDRHGEKREHHTGKSVLAFFVVPVLPPREARVAEPCSFPPLPSLLRF